MAEVLAVEPHHALVLVPLDEERAVPAADALVVQHGRVWDEDDAPAPLAKPHADIEIFAVQEVALVEQPDVVHGLPLHEDACAGNRLHGNRLRRLRLPMQVEIVEQPWESAGRPGEPTGESRKAEPADERPPRRGHGPSPAALLGAIRAGDVSTCHARTFIAVEDGTHRPDRTRGDDAVRIEQENCRLAGCTDAEIAAVREAAIHRRADHDEMRVGCETGDDGIKSLRIRRVIDHDHLAYLREHRTEASGEHLAGVVVDDHNADGGAGVVQRRRLVGVRLYLDHGHGCVTIAKSPYRASAKCPARKRDDSFGPRDASSKILSLP